MLFLFKLAGYQGKSVQELLSSTGDWEWEYWEAIYATQRFGDDRAELNAAAIQSIVANSAGLDRPTSPTDFIPEWWQSEEDQCLEHEIDQAFMIANAALKAQEGIL